MNSQTSAVVASASETPAPIMEANKLAPVVPSGMKGITVSDALVVRYCELVAAGKPTAKLFPNKLSEITFSAEQREMIRAARATHRLNCMVGNKSILAALRNPKVQIIGARSNAKESRGSIRWADERKKALSHSEIFGADPKVG